MEILIGWLHDTYTDENGAEVPYKEEFLSKVTGIKKGAEIWN